MAGGLALLPEADAQGLPKQSDALRDLAVAMAQQWYGIGVGARESRDVWLNEALPAFLADSFVGDRLGQASYDTRVERAQEYLQPAPRGRQRRAAGGYRMESAGAGQRLARGGKGRRLPQSAQ